MAINFQPAAPFSPTIAERFGETEQWNRFAPLLAQQYQASANRRSAESIATAQNQTSASATSASLQGRKQMQDAEIDAGRQQQQMQIAAQMQMQERQMAARLAEQQMENDRYNFAITRQEEQENVALLNGLAELDRQVEQKLITPEQGADARYAAIAKIKNYNTRKDIQQAKALEQQTKMQAKMFADNQKNIVEGKLFAKSLGGAEIMEKWNPETGDVELFDYDVQAGKWAKIGVRKPTEQKQVEPKMAMGEEWAPYTTKEGAFDLEAAVKRSETFAKLDYEDPKSPEARKWIKENVKGIEDTWREAKAKAQQQGQQPSAAPGAQQQQAPPQQPVQQGQPSRRPLPPPEQAVKMFESSINDRIKDFPSEVQAQVKPAADTIKKLLDKRGTPANITDAAELRDYMAALAEVKRVIASQPISHRNRFIP